MQRPRLEFGPDGFAVVMPGLAAFAAARRRLPIRYDQVASAEVAPVERAPTLVWARVGTHLPGVWEMGRFGYAGRKRFLFHGRRTRRVLALRLRGHPFTEVSVDVDDPEALLGELRLRAKLG